VIEKNIKSTFAPHSIQWELQNFVEQIQNTSETEACAKNRNAVEITKLPLRTRFDSLDELLRGLMPGELTFVSSADKNLLSDFIHKIASTLAFDSAMPVALCTPAVSTVTCQLRLFSITGCINRDALNTGDLAKGDWHKLTSAMNRLHKSMLYLYADDVSALSDLKCLLQELKKYSGLEAIFVDTIDELKINGLPTHDQLGDSIIAELHLLASDLHVPVVVSMGLMAKGDAKVDQEPSLQDLNLAGKTIQMVDQVVFLWEKNHCNTKTTDNKTVDVIVAKNVGATGRISLQYAEKCGLFSETMRFTGMA